MEEKEGLSLRVKDSQGRVWYARTIQGTDGKWRFKDPSFAEMARLQRLSEKQTKPPGED